MRCGKGVSGGYKTLPYRDCEGVQMIAHKLSANKTAHSRFPRRKRTRLEYFDYATPNCVIFTTSCTANAVPLFDDHALVTSAVECVKEERQRVGHAVYVFCFMPEHFHLLINPLESGVPVTRFMGHLHSRITKLAWDCGHAGKVLQRGFYDRVLRSTETVLDVGEYILNNPVRRGLVDSYEEYPYCGMMDRIQV